MEAKKKQIYKVLITDIDTGKVMTELRTDSIAFSANDISKAGENSTTTETGLISCCTPITLSHVLRGLQKITGEVVKSLPAEVLLMEMLTGMVNQEDKEERTAQREEKEPDFLSSLLKNLGR